MISAILFIGFCIFLITLGWCLGVHYACNIVERALTDSDHEMIGGNPL
jgi:4-hydroxy-3-methylbut-2-enyl diphosphate reductase IspH